MAVVLRKYTLYKIYTNHINMITMPDVIFIIWVFKAAATCRTAYVARAE